MVRLVVPSVEGLEARLDEQRAQIDLWVRQNGVSYSNRVISEGTLRVIALAAIALNPTPARIIAIEEPENGVHLQRLEHIANILAYAALEERGPRSQVLVNTHSPLFVAEALRLKREHPERVTILHVRHDGSGSRFSRMPDPGDLFQEGEIEDLLRHDEDAKVSALLARGLLDG
jgi:predicted ATPase